MQPLQVAILVASNSVCVCVCVSVCTYVCMRVCVCVCVCVCVAISYYKLLITTLLVRACVHIEATCIITQCFDGIWLALC